MTADRTRRGGEVRDFDVAWVCLQVITAIPAVFGTLLALLVLFGGLRAWAVLAPIAWIACNAGLATRLGERLAVRVGCGFRSPSDDQAAVLEALWHKALASSWLGPGQVDLYVYRSADVNAFAVGAHSVAVTTGAISALRRRQLQDAALLAILVHEIGHVRAPSTRLAFVMMSASAPWQIASRAVARLTIRGAGGGPRQLIRALLVGSAVVLAIRQSVALHHVAAAIALAGVAASAMVCPVAGAAVRRHNEYAADRFVMRAGLGSELALALQMIGTNGGPATRRRGLLARHPDVAKRLVVQQSRNRLKHQGRGPDAARCQHGPVRARGAADGDRSAAAGVRAVVQQDGPQQRNG